MTENATTQPFLYGQRREDQYQALVMLLLQQGRLDEAARMMERHEARREWEMEQERIARV